MIEDIKQKTKSILSSIIAHRRHIHSKPELSFQEYETSAYIKEVLGKLSIPHISCAETGVIGIIGNGDKCCGLRADMDALPIKEETGLEFTSERDGVMHACGHDFHTAMLLGAAEVLKSFENRLNGCVKLLFQPGEEKLPGGAKIMIEQGALKDPAPEIIFGQHVSPSEETGAIAISPGPVMASADELYWTILGKGTHAAQPHLGDDPIITAAHLIIYLQSMISKFRDPLNPGVLTIASIQSGFATNIIPGEAELKGTLRAFDNNWREKTLIDIEYQSKNICKLYNTDCEFTGLRGYPPVINDETAVKIAKSAANGIIGGAFIQKFEPLMWAEDFGYFASAVPSAFWKLGVKPKKLLNMPSIHNPAFAPDEDALYYGAAMLAGAAVMFLNGE